MKPVLLNYLVCPNCQADLDCQVISENGSDIETGTLRCTQCHTDYPIVRGIPRFVTIEQPLEGDNIQTAAAFGWEWQKFNKLHDVATYEAQFLDWISPIQPEFFKERVVLDAGCGMGRFPQVSHNFGAKMVLAVDASDAVEAARENTQHIPNIHVIQGDILNLPFRQGQNAQIEFIYSIGVLHHLDNPQAGFEALVKHLQPNGSIFAWVYGCENNGWVVNIVNPIRTRLTSRWPRSILYGVSWLITAGLQIILRLLYRPANSVSALHWLAKMLPYNDYLAWLAQFQFRHNHHVVFDHLVAPVAFYICREEFERWFEEARLEVIDISWRNKNSWRGHGLLRVITPQKTT